MKRFLNLSSRIGLVYLLPALFLSGCLVRTYTVVKDRVDQEVSGNQGFLSGSVPSDYKQPPKKFIKRRTKVVEIEFGEPLKESDAPITRKKTDAISEFDLIIPEKKAEPKEELSFEAVLTRPKPRAKVVLVDTYIVQKNDTLQKISSRPEVYGTVNKWTKIYEANKKMIISPDKIRPGQVLKIPRD